MKRGLRPILLVAALLTCMIAPAQAQFEDVGNTVDRRGTTAAEFLNIPVGARATAMGGAVSATIDDATAIYWNPGGTALMPQGVVAFDYATWLVGIDFGFAAIAWPTGMGTVGASVTSMQTEEMDVTTVEAQNGTGERFTASSLAIGFTYSRRLTDRFSVGSNVKYVTERIWNSSSHGVAFDVGTLFTTPFSGIRLGAAISNFGTKMSISGDELLVVADIDPNNAGNNESNRAYLKTDQFDMPLTMRVGLAGEPIEMENGRLTIAVDAAVPNNSEAYVNTGAELSMLGELLQLRVGYSELFLRDALRSWTFGAGLEYGFGNLQFNFDYAYETQKYFSGVNRFTLALGL
jgi:hypothetical protein